MKIMLIPAKYKLINVIIIIVRDLKIYDGDADKSVTSNISFMSYNVGEVS